MSIQDDSLMDILLCEVLGGESPTDLAPRIFAAARARRRRRLAWIVPSAAAALLAAAVAGSMLFPPGYPEPCITGTHVVEDARSFERGATVAVAGQPASLELGGYCRIDIEPRTRLRVDGLPHDEAIFLHRGAVTCEVERNIGAFTVGTELGTVSVTGTRFTVRIVENEGEVEMRGGRAALALAVAVLAGSVTVEYQGKSYALSAGADRVFAAESATPKKAPTEEAGKPADKDEKAGIPESVRGFSGMVSGTVVEKGEKNVFWLRVAKVLKVWKNNKAKTPKDLEGRTVRVGPRWKKGENGKWHPVELHVAFIKKLEEKQELTVEIANHEGDFFSILELSKEQREWAAGGGDGGEEAREKDKETGGSLTGIVTRLNKKWLEVKAEGDKEPRRYFLEEPAKDVYGTNLVELVWKKDDGRRVVSVKSVVPSKKKGTVTGVVTARGETFIDVKPDDGPTERYIPRWIGGMPKDGGGLDKDMLKILAKVKVGAKVKVSWIYEERKRVIGIDD